MMILSVVLRLNTAQADITTAFIHAELPPEEQVFIHQPCSFKVHCDEGELVLRLKHSLWLETIPSSLLPVPLIQP